MDIEEIAQWESLSVVDCDGKKIGHIEDVYLAAGTSEAVFAYIKAGMLGRRHCLVALAGARVVGDQVRVVYEQGHVKGAPQVEPGATFDRGMEQDLARHYEIELTPLPVGDAPRYESARALNRREAQARAMTERADELTELGAAIRQARDGLPHAGDDTRGDHEPPDEPTRQQPPSP
jgi:hypothetical protein